MKAWVGEEWRRISRRGKREAAEERASVREWDGTTAKFDAGQQHSVMEVHAGPDQ